VLNNAYSVTDELRGSIYLADRRPHRYIPPPVPVPAPTAAPTPKSEILSGGGLNRTVGDTGLTLGQLLALALGVLVVAGTVGMIIYCCCCMVPIIPLLKKKKKKEEEDDSPYTVHSYAGYVEDEFYVPPAPPVLLVEEEDEAIKKDLKKEKSVKFMENGELRKMFPYKVYGPRGYVEEENDTIPEDLLVQKKEQDEQLHGAHKQAPRERYEAADDAAPMKGLPPPPPAVSRHDSYESRHSRQSQHEYRHSHSEERYEQYTEEQRTSWVERARQSYESSYSLHSHGSALTDEDGTVYHSMSSLTSQSAHPSSHGHNPYALDGPQHAPRTTSFYNYDDLHDDETVMSGATHDTSRSSVSLVHKAKENYRKIISQSQMQSTTVTSSYQQVTTGAAGSSRLDADSASVVSGHSADSGGSAGGFVAAAKEKYARLKSGSGSQTGESRGTSTVADSETRGSSLVDKLKVRPPL
jgi:hypothetical protein